MDIQRYYHDHAQIFRQIDTLRELSRAGVRENAVRISEIITGTASTRPIQKRRVMSASS